MSLSLHHVFTMSLSLHHEPESTSCLHHEPESSSSAWVYIIDLGSSANNGAQSVQCSKALVFPLIRSVVPRVDNVLHQQRAVSQLLPPLVHHGAQHHAVLTPCEEGGSCSCIALRLAVQLQHAASHRH
ncbi:hypothetical protein F7725_020123 [Dissostichus mawsoni]|uniref:Uncharacterized protein n=1 Tax=Dissostichus mawsoni TaxID=36200 RepID=A0A7J5YCF1_DISMA|nr:hypothetical protein F7725_020123 [Dissostichus mawsoni]